MCERSSSKDTLHRGITWSIDGTLLIMYFSTHEQMTKTQLK
jgi:hypothetical protein